MAPRQLKMPERKSESVETEPVETFSQARRADSRYLLQVDRQTKGSYQNLDAAKSAAQKIKKDYPLLHVSVYDTVESAASVLTASADSK